MVLITFCSRTTTTGVIRLRVNAYQTRRSGKKRDLGFGDMAAGEGDGAAFPAGVLRGAVEVQVVGPVGVRHSAAATELRTHKHPG